MPSDTITGANGQTTNESIAFLKQLRPSGPWVLTAIIPDGPTDTVTATTEAEADTFIRKHNGKQNLYFSVNPTRKPMNSKASKSDIAAIEYVFADLDPRESETPAAAKERYLAALTGNVPTAIIDSGNGIQALWRLTQRIELPDVAAREQWAQVVADVEKRTGALTRQLGGTTGTQNIDRILRLPGTLNLPNKTKLNAGRVQCASRLLAFNGVAYSFDTFPLSENDAAAPPSEPSDNDRSHESDDSQDDDELWRTIADGGGKRHCKDKDSTGRSEAVWYVINELLRRGYASVRIERILLNRTNRISDHIYDQSKPRAYVKKQVAAASKAIDFARDKTSRPYLTPNNIRIALLKLGIAVRYDQFADRTEIIGLAEFGPVLEDAAVDRLWLTFDQRFHFQPGRNLLFTVLMDTARLNCFHPVCDYLDGLRWDGIKRIDRWLSTYGGAPDNEYTRTVGELILVAAVRRVRQPGCKFDEMLVLEDPTQGTEKSSALAVLAVKESWFTDDLPLTADSKRVIESLRGRWIVEAAELSGLRRADTEHLKATLSRQVDRARMSYDRLVTERPRQCVIFGTTNSEEYLRDTTGNRRYWPVRVRGFDIAALKRDRDQLWAEAAMREAAGASIRLDPSLWRVAADEQVQRLTSDPYFDTLQHELTEFEGKIASKDVWTILDIRTGMRNQEHNRRMGEAMRKIGWRRPSKSGLIKIGGKPVVGYVKGEKPWRIVCAWRDQDTGDLQVGYDYVELPEDEQ